jgi:DNA (cytosine-5)-methyltransferase 1
MGKFQKILNLQRKQYAGTLYKIRAKYHHQHIVCTEEHPFYVREKVKKWNPIKNNYDMTYTTPEWIHAKDITKEHMLGMVVNTKAIIPDVKTLSTSEEWYSEGYTASYIPEWVQDAPNDLVKMFVKGFESSPRFNESIKNCDIQYSLQRLYLKMGQQDDNTFIEGEYAWFSINDIDTCQVEDESVYNFEVEQDNSYIVENVIVHNCQGFSQGGKKLPDDPRNTLFRDFARSAELIKPKYIIGENVDGLLSRKTATGENYIDVIVAEFERIGYNVAYQVCHAVQYGVPQLRKRLIYVGIRKDLNRTFVFPEPLNDGKHDLPNLKNIIEFSMQGAIKINPDDFDMTTIPQECIVRDMDNDEDEDTDNIHPYLRLKAKVRDQQYGEKIHETTLSFGKRESPIHAEVIDIRNPSKTIICTYDHQPRLFVPLQNKKGYFLRPILPDELKQIQGFPKDFKLNGTKKEQIKQIGNAAPPPLVYHIVKQILEG